MASKWTVNITPRMERLSASAAQGVTDPVDKALGRSASGFGDKLRTATKRVGVAMTAVGAIGAGVMVSAVKDAAALQQSVGGMEVVFANSSKVVDDWAKGAAQSMGITRNAALETANKMGSMYQGMGFSAAESAEMTTKAAKRAADVASIMGIDLASAMESVTGSAKGNLTMMDNLGVAMTQETIAAYAASKGLFKMEGDTTKLTAAQIKLEKAESKAAEMIKKHGKGSLEARDAINKVQQASEGVTNAMGGQTTKMTQQQKIQAAYLMFMDKTSKYHNNFENEANTAAGAYAIATAAFANAKTELGYGLMPILAQVAAALNKTVIPAIEKFSKIMQDNPALASTIAVGLTAVIGSLLVLGPLMMMVDVWVKSFKALNAAMTLLSLNPIGLLIIAIVGLAIGLVVLYKRSEKFRKIVGGAFEAVMKAGKSTFNWLKKNWPLILGILGGPFGVAVALIARYWTQIKTGISTAWNAIKSAISIAVNAIINFLKITWPLILGILIGPVGLVVGLIIQNWNKLTQATTAAWNRIKSAISSGIAAVVGIGTKIKNAFSSAGQWLYNAGRKVVDGFVRGIRSMGNVAKAAAKAVVGGVRDFFPFSPAKVGPFSGKGYTLTSGQRLMVDFAKGVRQGEPEARKTTARSLGAIISSMPEPTSAADGKTQGAGVIYNQHITTPEPETASDVWLATRRAAFGALGA